MFGPANRKYNLLTFPGAGSSNTRQLIYENKIDYMAAKTWPIYAKLWAVKRASLPRRFLAQCGGQTARDRLKKLCGSQLHSHLGSSQRLCGKRLLSQGLLPTWHCGTCLWIWPRRCFPPSAKSSWGKISRQHMQELLLLWARRSKKLGATFQCPEFFLQTNHGKTINCQNPKDFITLSPKGEISISIIFPYPHLASVHTERGALGQFVGLTAAYGTVVALLHFYSQTVCRVWKKPIFWSFSRPSGLFFFFLASTVSYYCQSSPRRTTLCYWSKFCCCTGGDPFWQGKAGPAMVSRPLVMQFQASTVVLHRSFLEERIRRAEANVGRG